MSARVTSAALAREAGRGAALDRVTRTMALALGVGTAVFVALAIGGFLSQYDDMSPVWTWGVVLTAFVPALAAAILSPWLPARVVRRLLGVAAVGYLTGLILTVPAITTPTGTLPPDAGTPWVLSVSAIGTCAAAVAWRPFAAWVYLGVTIVTLGLTRVGASAEFVAHFALQDAVYTLLFDAIFVALAIATARAGRTLDAAADRAISDTRAAAGREAAARERSRIDAFIHDSVLVALLASARRSPRAADAARAALASLDRDLGARRVGPVSREQWIWRLQALATDLAPTARFSHEQRGTSDLLPADVAEAILEASAEALRNSVAHAGPASRAVHARVGDGEVEVEVLDDGVGFDTAAVPAARLGVAISILDRVNAIPGGRAAVVSQPGVGTRVVLGWRAA